MDTILRRTGFLTLLLFFSLNTSALVISFDDITLNPESDIPDGYAGYNWQVYDEFGYDAVSIPDVSDDSYAETSGEYAFRGTGFSIVHSMGKHFSVVNMVVANENCDAGINLCSAGSVRLQGLVGGGVSFDIEYFFNPNDLSSIILEANFSDIEEFRVWNSAAELMSLDNLQLVAVPLPAAWMFSLSSLTLLVAAGRRRRMA